MEKNKKEEAIDLIKQYDQLLPDAIKVSLTADNAGFYAGEFLKAINELAYYYSYFLREYNNCKIKRKEMESIAFIDKSIPYLKEKGEDKPSATIRTQYIDIDPDVIKTRQIEIESEAFIKLLDLKMDSFKAMHFMSKEILSDGLKFKDK